MLIGAADDAARLLWNTITGKKVAGASKGLSGAIFGNPARGFHIGLEWTRGAITLGIPIAAYQLYHAPKGHKVSSLIGETTKIAAGFLGTVVGGFVAGPMGAIAGAAVGEESGALLEDTVQGFIDFGRSIRRVNMGGNYQDSVLALTMRQRAAQELGGSIMNARQYLGKEGRLFHQ